MSDARPKKLSADEQVDLDNCLRDAAWKGNTESVQTLLAAGANVHAQDDRALRDAASRGHTETVKILLANGADVHAWDDWALRLAARDGHTETVKVLLAAGANVHAQDDAALPWAAWNGRVETVKVLLAVGANVHARDDDALCWAAKDGHTETVKVLVGHIFAPESWRGKSRAEIEGQAAALYDRIEAENPQPERLRQAGMILLDCAIDCWHEVRPIPQLKISPFPAQPRPL